MKSALRIPPLVRLAATQPRALVSTRDGGRVALDSPLLSIWQSADGLSVDEIIQRFSQFDPAVICAALVCLVHAGLLDHADAPAPRVSAEPVRGDLLSIIIVGYNSASWLPGCLASLALQTYAPLEIIFIDNASRDDSVKWVRAHFPAIQLIRLNEPRALAYALNLGIAHATGKFFLLLNPDTILEPDALAQMLRVAQRDPACAAVAAKLRFDWARGFLNGLGNFVGGFYWSADNGLGHLDLGQFDTLDQIPSACFAAVLIARAVWDAVGSLDEAFPLYYEDSEWCYRARLLGYTIRAAPQAIVYHALGARVPGTLEEITPAKLRNVAYGRLRFAIKLLPTRWLARFLIVYLGEDLFAMFVAGLQRRGEFVRARWGAWRQLARELTTLRRERRALRQRQRVSAHAVFCTPRAIAPPLTWYGLPELTLDLVAHYYLPLLKREVRRAIPEFFDADRITNSAAIAPTGLARARLIWQTQGAQLFLFRLWRFIQWQLTRIYE